MIITSFNNIVVLSGMPLIYRHSSSLMNQAEKVEITFKIYKGFSARSAMGRLIISHAYEATFTLTSYYRTEGTGVNVKRYADFQLDDIIRTYDAPLEYVNAPDISRLYGASAIFIKAINGVDQVTDIEELELTSDFGKVYFVPGRIGHSLFEAASKTGLYSDNAFDLIMDGIVISPFLHKRRLQTVTHGDISYKVLNLFHSELEAMAANNHPIFFVGNNAGGLIRTATDEDICAPTLDITGTIYGYDSFRLFSEYLEDMGDFFLIENTCYAIRVVADIEADEVYLFRFKNIFGVYEYMMLAGVAMIEPVVDDAVEYTTNSEGITYTKRARRNVNTVYKIKTGGITIMRRMELMDMLCSDYTEMFLNGLWYECLITYTPSYNALQRTPDQYEITARLAIED